MLSAKKLFWIALGISVLLATIYASISIESDRISFFFGLTSVELGEFFEIDSESAQYLYLLLFSKIFVPFWLGGMAIALGLISVSSVFPNFMQPGSIDVAVSKPVSRITLFFTKYIGSLFFVGIQVLVFCVIVFFAIGLRTGEWVFGVFSTVWLIIFAFSLIYCVAVLTAVWTRSSLLSLLMAFLVWGVSWGIQLAESKIHEMTYGMAKLGVEMNFEDGSSEITGEEKSPDSGMVKFHKWLKMVSAPLPKSREVTYLVQREIVIQGKDLTQFGETDELDPISKLKVEAQREHANRNSKTFILGTSLVFELVILGLACFSFVRKDY
ncbi:MAG: hypothetical protein AB8F34_13075 [Akkermansiaceae bacterium]